ncbi:MAG: TerB family tellurite resistance protein [Pseudomonas sp.]
MLWPATFVGATAGLALASIPGALLGILLGQVVDRRMALESWADLRGRLKGARASGVSDQDLLFVLLGRLAKSDGQVLEVHIQQARAEMQRLQLVDGEQRRAIEAFTRGKNGQDGLRVPLRRLRSQLRVAEEVLRACWRMAWADGRATSTERELIVLWGKWLGLGPDSVAALGAEFEPRKTTQVASTVSYEQALRVLNVAHGSDVQTIKNAYRRLLSRHHPDKLVGAGASAAKVREATEKTRELHSAYAVVREQRGFR